MDYKYARRSAVGSSVRRNVDVNPNLWTPPLVRTSALVRIQLLPPTLLQTELGLTITVEQLSHFVFNIRRLNPMGTAYFHKVLGHVFFCLNVTNLADCTVDPNKITQLAWRP